MKALELADAEEQRAIASGASGSLIADELRRLANVNAELLGALEKSVQPLELYKAYGWPDRAGVIFNAKKVIAKAKE